MPYQKGQSGNSAGRPKGASDKRTALRALLAPHAQELVAKAIELAKSGDTTALRLCLERLIPPVKARDEPVELETAGGTLSEQGRGVLQAVACGRITPHEAATLMQALSAQTRVVEAEELLKRVEALEEALDRRTDGTAYRTYHPA